VSDDELLFEEPNELFWVGLSKTLDGQYILIDSASKESSEVRAVDLSLSSSDSAKNSAVVLAPRRHKVSNAKSLYSPILSNVSRYRTP
jgi:oligopeptidase B